MPLKTFEARCEQRLCSDKHTFKPASRRVSCNDPCVSTRWPLHPAVLPLLLFSAISICANWLLTHKWKTAVKLLSDQHKAHECILLLMVLKNLFLCCVFYVMWCVFELCFECLNTGCVCFVHPPQPQVWKQNHCSSFVSLKNNSGNLVQNVPLRWGSGFLTTLLCTQSLIWCLVVRSLH